MAVNGVYIVQGELNALVAHLRRGQKWQNAQTSSEQDVLLRSFVDLREVLSTVADLSDMAPSTFLTPFLEVIRSEHTSGLVTGQALSAIGKFLSYGLVDPDSLTAPGAVQSIADSVNHTRFVGTDAGSDEVVLFRILQVLRALLLTPVGVLLTDESVCELLQSCFRICFEKRLSELLRKSAESCLIDMVQLLFTRLPTFVEDPKHPYVRRLKMRAEKKARPQQKPDFTGGKPVSDQENPVVSQEIQESSSEKSNLYEEKPILAGLEPVITGKQPVLRPDSSHFGDGDREKIDIGTVYEVGGAKNDSELEKTGSEEPEKTGSDENNTDENAGQTDLTAENENVTTDEPQLSEKTTDSEQNQPEHSSAHELINERGVKFSSTALSDNEDDENNNINATLTASDPLGKVPGASESAQSPYGLPCVRELVRFLISISNPEERQNSEDMLELGLNLLIISLEAGADFLGQFGILLPLIKNELCRNLNLTLLHIKPSIFAATLRVGFLCFEALRTHLKFQLEYYLVRLKEIILADQAALGPNFGRGSAAGSAFFERKELALEALVELWRIPGLVTELYLNYDCDLYCSNLFEELTKLLSKNAFSVLSELTSTHVLSLDALLTVIDSIEINCHYRMLNYKDRHSHLTSAIGQMAAPGGHVTDPQSLTTNAKQQEDKLNTSPSHLLPMASGISAGRLISQHQNLANSPEPGSFIGQEPPTSRDYSDSASFGAVRDDQQILLDVLRFPQLRPNRMPISADLIFSHEDLIARKQKKRLLQTGTDLFNQSPSKGVVFLQDHGLFRTPLVLDHVVEWLKENPHLDKRKIAEYIVNRKNVKILEAFVRSFNFRGLRLDQALRSFLETFRLPGEAAEISMVIEHFAEHWHSSNDHPFATVDAAFTLAYAVIMLNVDQHNPLAKRQNQPMTVEAFKKNLSGVNGGGDFDQSLLEEIFKAIRQKEIIMPAEQTGAVRENYVWKLLLKRGQGQEGRFIHAPPGLYDHDLFQLVWGPTVAALSYVFDKTHDESVTSKCASGFRKCAAVAAHYAMSDVFDNLVVNLCKFSQILTAGSQNGSLLVGSSGSGGVPISSASSMIGGSGGGVMLGGHAGAYSPNGYTSIANDQLILEMAENPKSQCAAKCLFQLLRNYGDILRDGWRNVVECLLQLYRSDLLPPSLTQVEDFADPSGQINIRNRLKSKKSSTKSDSGSSSGIFSSFYIYLGGSGGSSVSNSGDQEGQNLTPEERRLLKLARETVAECKPEQLIAESKYLSGEALAEFLKALVVGGATLANLHGSGQSGSTPSGPPFDAIGRRPRATLTLNQGAQGPPLGATLNDELESAVVFYLELILGVCLENRDRLTPYWRTIRAHIFSLIIDLGENNRFLVERCVVAILRLTSRLLTRSVCGSVTTAPENSNSAGAIVDEIFGALGALLTAIRRQTFSALSRQIAGGLYEILRLNAQNIQKSEHWAVVFDLIEAAGAAVFTDFDNFEQGQVQNQAAFGPHKRRISQFRKPGLAQSDNEGSRDTDKDDQDEGIERGYTSDSEIYAPSLVQNQQQKRLDQSDSRASSGEWMYVTEKDVDQSGTSSGAGLTFGPPPPSTPLVGVDSAPRRTRPRIHDSSAYFKCCETLAFLIRSPDHVTPENFDLFLRCLRTLVDAGLDAGSLRDVTSAATGAPPTVSPSSKKRHTNRKTISGESGEGGPISGLTENLEQVSLQLIDLIHTLHVDSAQIFRQFYANFDTRAIDHQSAGQIWVKAWRPLLQVLSHICCDQRRRVRLAALTYLQRALLVPDLKILSVDQWEDCCYHVLFPLLTSLLYENNGSQLKSRGDHVTPAQKRDLGTSGTGTGSSGTRFRTAGSSDPETLAGLDEARVRAVTLTSKVFLQHLGPLSCGPNFVDLFLAILSLAQSYLQLEESPDLQESVPESVKNMLLVIDTAKLFQQNHLLAERTRQKLSEFLPQLIDMVTLVDDQQPANQVVPGNHVISGGRPEGHVIPYEDHSIPRDGHVTTPAPPSDDQQRPPRRDSDDHVSLESVVVL